MTPEQRIAEIRERLENPKQPEMVFWAHARVDIEFLLEQLATREPGAAPSLPAGTPAIQKALKTIENNADFLLGPYASQPGYMEMWSKELKAAAKVLREIETRRAPAGTPRCPKCGSQKVGILAQESRGMVNVVKCPDCNGQWACSGLYELFRFFSAPASPVVPRAEEKDVKNG